VCALHGRVTGTERSLFELNVYIILFYSKEIQKEFTDFQRNNLEHYLSTMQRCAMEESLPCRKNRNSGRKFLWTKVYNCYKFLMKGDMLR
jgi:hypothetical protein